MERNTSTTFSNPSSRSFSKPEKPKPLDKPPLVTPSASPPPLRRKTATSTHENSRPRPQNGWSNGQEEVRVPYARVETGRSTPILSSSALFKSHRASGSVPPPPPPSFAPQPARRAQSRLPSATPKPGGFFSSSSSSSGFFSGAGPFRGSSLSSSGSRQHSVLGEEAIDIEKERQASLNRLEWAWSGLDKYVRNWEDDDVVHLGTGKIIKDNGVLKGLKSIRWFGDRGGEGDDPADLEEEDYEEEEDEEDDQLDTLRDVDDGFGVEDEVLEIQVQAPTAAVPPVTTSDEKDAEDLRAFLAMGDAIGDEPEDDTDCEVDEPYEDTDARASSEVPSENLYELEQEDDTDDQRDALALEDSDAAGPEESDSEDELNFNWAEDEASIVVPVNGPQEELDVEDDDDDDDVVEIIEPPLPPKPTAPTKSRQTTEPVQLYTPPHSRSSIDTPPAQDHAFLTPPPLNDQPADISPEIPITENFSSKSKVSAPPLSNLFSPSGKKPVKSIFPSASSSAPSPLDVLSKTKGDQQEGSNPPAPPRRKFKLIPQVVLERRTPMRDTRPKVEDPAPEATPEPSPSKKRKTKEKEKEKEKKSRVVSDASDSEGHETDKPVHVDEGKKEKKAKRKSRSVSPTKVVEQSSSSSKPSSSKSHRREQSPKALKPATSKSKANVFPSRSDEEEEDKSADEEEESSPAPSSPRKRKRSAASGREDREVSPSKQTSSRSKKRDESDQEEEEPASSSKDARRSVNQRSPRKRKSKSHSRRSPDSGSGSDEPPTDGDQGRPQEIDPQYYAHYHNARAGSYLPPPPPPPPPGMYAPYPGAFYPHPMPPHQQQHQQQQQGNGVGNPPSASSAGPSHSQQEGGGAPYALPDPQAQYLFSRMMQFAAATLWGHPPPGMPGAGAPPQTQHGHQHQQHAGPSSSSPMQQQGQGHGGPFSTPTHAYRRGRSQSHGPAGPVMGSGAGEMQPMFATPPTHHQHPGMMYNPYFINPDMSRATAPPDTPEHALASSSPVHGELAQWGGGSGVEWERESRSYVRRKKGALVERSRSRGRSVSFAVEKRESGSRRRRRRRESESEDEEEEEEEEEEGEREGRDEDEDEDEEMEEVDAPSSPLAKKSRSRRKGKERERERFEDEDSEEEEEDAGEEDDIRPSSKSRSKDSKVEREKPRKDQKVSATSSSAKHHHHSSTGKSKKQGDKKGLKVRAPSPVVADSQDEGGDDGASDDEDERPLSRSHRGTTFVRGQTPGPTSPSSAPTPKGKAKSSSSKTN